MVDLQNKLSETDRNEEGEIELYKEGKGVETVRL